MNFSKTLTSAVAAASIVGAVGLAYAQTTTETVPPTTTPSTAQEPSMAPTQAPSDPSSTVTPTTPSNSEPAATTSDMASEPLPKADRN